MTFRRLIAIVLAAIVIIALLVALVWIVIDDRCSKAESTTHPKQFVQEVPFK